MRFLILFLFLLTATGTFAQLSRKEKKAAKKGEQISQPTTLSPGSAEVRTPKQARKKGKATGPTYNSQKEFDARMEARGKTSRKNEKMMSKPQYSNPMYFGHKRPPKKRSSGKLKYCKECGIRH
jgi:hypothetical protein